MSVFQTRVLTEIAQTRQMRTLASVNMDTLMLTAAQTSMNAALVRVYSETVLMRLARSFVIVKTVIQAQIAAQKSTSAGRIRAMNASALTPLTRITAPATLASLALTA